MSIDKKSRDESIQQKLTDDNLYAVLDCNTDWVHLNQLHSYLVTHFVMEKMDKNLRIYPVQCITSSLSVVLDYQARRKID